MEVGIWEMLGGVVATFATAGATFVFTRRQNKVEIEKLQQEVETMRTQRENEVKSAEVEIMEKYRELYNKLVSDLGAQMEQLKKDNAKYRDQIRKLEQSDNELRKELIKLKSEFPCADCPRRN